MSPKIVEISCPGCGARVSTGQKECEWCHSPIVISTFNSVYSMPGSEITDSQKKYSEDKNHDNHDNHDSHSAAMCYLKLKKYDKALLAFEKAMEDNFDNSETFFYAAICLLQGKKAFLHLRPTIDKILEYINAALMIEPKGIYYYFLAYIKYDYFARKCFKTEPSYQDALAMAESAGLSEFDVEQLYNILGVARPACL